MNTLTIIVIVVVALLTLIVFGLSWLAYSSCVKSYKMEVSQGKHDEEIQKERKAKKKGGLLRLIGSYIVLFSLLSLFATGVIYKSNKESFSINNQTALVIKTGSMSDFYNEDVAKQYDNDRTLHFDVGDICIFDNVSQTDELAVGDVYGYKHYNMIIVHRLISIEGDLYMFRGDNNPSFDGSVKRKDIIYHYTGNRIKGIGSFILYAQSIFGIWSLLGVCGVCVASEIVCWKIGKIEKERHKFLEASK